MNLKSITTHACDLNNNWLRFKIWFLHAKCIHLHGKYGKSCNKILCQRSLTMYVCWQILHGIFQDTWWKNAFWLLCLCVPKSVFFAKKHFAFITHPNLFLFFYSFSDNFKIFVLFLSVTGRTRQGSGCP